jgi:3-oxoacyl-[acyl-carrier-protein] synthase-3
MALGAREPVEAAVADGRYDPAFHEAHGYASISVATDRDAADLAVDAARTAIARSGADPARIGAFIHTHTTAQGPDGLQPALYLQGRLANDRARAIEVRQGCNGAIAALEVGCLYLATAAELGVAVLTTGDKHHDEADRYRDDQGCVPADGATAVVLSRGDGVAQVLSTEVVGDGRFTDAADVDPQGFADRREYRAELKRRLLPMLQAMAEAKRASVRTALDDAKVSSAEVSRWVLPNTGRFMVDKDFRAEFGIDDSRTVWEWGRTTGHLTVGDQIAGLTHLLETGALEPGERVVLIADGVGFSFGCAVLEVVRKTVWPADDDH